MADNILMGDMDGGLDLPQAELEQSGLVEEKKMAQYTKTPEFQRIREHCEARIAFYQTHLPNGKLIGLETKPTDVDWIVANLIIGEFNLLMNSYETATEAVENEI